MEALGHLLSKLRHLGLHLFPLFLVVACSFSSSDDEELVKSSSDNSEVRDFNELRDEDLKKMDTSGDFISDYDKLQMGLDPFVADIPELRIRFLQNYKITVHWQSVANSLKEGSFVIDTRVGRGDPDFQYRVGNILVREQSFREASRVGRFSTHHWGDIRERDLSWVSFPEIDPRFYHQNLLKYAKYFDEEKYLITNIQIELENTARLNPHPLYSLVKDLELNFYFYNYEREAWEKLKNIVVDRRFHRGQAETFNVSIENAPVNLIRDNFFSKGEFIISEVGDFKIDEEGQTLKNLLGSVKNKSTQVIINTPHETETLYVARPSGKVKISEILETLYDTNFIIENDEVKKIGAFENNLPDFTYLKEIRDLEKRGRWFVFTERLRRHYLDYQFEAGEVVNLSYITGNKLARQSSEKVHSVRESISGGSDYKVYPLGNISANSRVDIQLSPGRRLGDEIKSWDDEFIPNYSGCNGNCYRAQFKCNFKFNIFEKRNESFKFDRNFKKEIENLSLVINSHEFPVVDLLNDKHLSFDWRGDNLHLHIKDIEDIKRLNEARENVLFLKINTERGRVFEGVNLIRYSGRDKERCFELTMNVAGSNKWPIYSGSRDFSRWRGWVNWNVVKRSGKRNYSKPFTIGLSSTINNFHN